MPNSPHEIWMSKPTWGNHPTIFTKAGFQVKVHPYWDAENRCLDYEGMIAALKTATPGALVLVHGCAHNPTGVDPTHEQWRGIAKVMKDRGLVPFLDTAYQGYASGDLIKDGWSIRLLLNEGFEFFIAQSFAKNAGLYGERIGMMHIVCKTRGDATRVLSQLKGVIRPMYSSPPIHGAFLLAKVLGDKNRFARWKEELRGMAERILEMRALLREGLEAKGTPGTWNHITDQIGMFSFTGLTPAQSRRMIQKHHVYLLETGRISMCGLNTRNVDYVVAAIDEVVRNG